MTVRTKDSLGSNASLEVIAQRLSGLQAQVNSMSNSMSNMEIKTDITKASPGIPFKIDEEKRNDGIYILVSMTVPSNAARVNITLVNRFQNTSQAGESTQDSIKRAKAHLQEFTVKVSDNERASNLCIQYIGPFQPKDNPLRNQYHLVLLEVKSKGEKALTPNPMSDPFATFPFQVFKVRNDGANDTENTYFSIGDTSVGKKPSKPDKSLIVMNDVNLETQAADATLQFKIFAAVDTNGNPDMTTTFADLDINEAYIGLRLFSQTPDTMGDTGEPLKPGGPIADKTKPFTIVEIVLPLGKRYLWTRNITKNASGKEVNTPGVPVDFYAGGDIGTTGLPELSGGTGMMGGLFTIAAIQLDNTHTEVQLRIKQRGAMFLAVLLKRIILGKTLPSGTRKNIEEIKLLDREDVFTRTADVIIAREIKHVANRTGIIYSATLIGVGHTQAAPIQREASPAMADSTFSVAPSAPAAGLFFTAPDSDTDEANDSYADFTVFASATDNTKTFADTGCNTVYIVLRKSGGLSDDDPNDDRLPKKIFPVENLNVTNIVCRVRDLKTGRQYIWQRNIAERAGSTAKSVSGTTLTFRAGQMLIDPGNVTVSIISISQQGSSFIVTVRVQQSTMAALLRTVSLFKDRGDGQGFIEIANSITRIKSKPEFQVPNSSNTVQIEINALRNTSVQLRPRVTAVGGLTKDGTAVAGVATGGSPPTMTCSFPMAGDIVVNTIQADISTGIALVGIRVFATWQRGNTGLGGTGPGGSLSFNDVAADDAATVIADGATFANDQIAKAANFDPTQNFTDITVELVIGKTYAVKRNITYREGIALKSQVSNLLFVAGGRLGMSGFADNAFPGLTFTLSVIGVLDANGQTSNKEAEAIITIVQPTPAYLLKAVVLQRKRTVDGEYKNIGERERILDNFQSQLSGSTTIIKKIIPVSPNQQLNVKAILIGLGDGIGGNVIRDESNIVTAIMPADVGFGDTDRPQWSGAPGPGQSFQSPFLLPNFRGRWKPTGINLKGRLPDLQVKTLRSVKVWFEFLWFPNNVATFNPVTGQATFGQAIVAQNLGGTTVFDPNYAIDIGRTLNSFFEQDRPAITGARGSSTYDATLGGKNGLPDFIADGLLSAYNMFQFAFLQIRIVVINGLNPLNEATSAIGFISTPIDFPFVPSGGSNVAQDGGIYIPT